MGAITELFTLANLLTLLMLIALQAVLGFDNLLYISLESKRVAEESQQKVRRMGIGLAIVLRIVLLYIVVKAIKSFEDPFLTIGSDTEGAWMFGAFNLASVVEIAGGGFILYTAMKEIYHMLSVHEVGHGEESAQRTVGSAIFWIVLMNLVFSFDSILSAMALTDSIAVMAVAIVISGVLMMVMADHVSEFLKRNRMYEVLGLFILFIVGIMLVSEGGHNAHLAFFGYHVEAMQKTTFYFVLVVLVVVDIIQGRYQKKLMAQQAAEAGKHA
ncbi:TerC family protein [Rosistilla oblonga]|uniref:TerC family protein n=1 Tax=Rosistilla oblonga TaxID=2527990 RepID=UPI003A97559A